MASLNLTQEELKAVEQSRQRLSQLSHSIGSLRHDVLTSNPLPDLDSLQASADILQHNLRSLLEILAVHNDLFQRIAVHPSTNFPGRTQENILLQLLRKKPEPDVEAAMDEGREALARLASTTTTTTTAGTTSGQGGLRNGGTTKNHPAAAAELTAEQQRQQTAELESTWNAARDFCLDRIRQYAQDEDDDPYTEEEREIIGIANVRTGLRKPQYDPFADDDDDEDGEGGDGGDDDVMIVDRPPPPPAPGVATAPPEVEGTSLENLLRFSARGEFVPT
ncbi:mediator of RNA polymerase II transcription subunit 8 [Diatrype stigma]|uniref:Mediator of RNA polymerase II transcription subunit 8 n=1 Tax=Diatrype stigma TaxID=117547 RepID=A0AAN9UJV1_9PEZI